MIVENVLEADLILRDAYPEGRDPQPSRLILPRCTSLASSTRSSPLTCGVGPSLAGGRTSLANPSVEMSCSQVRRSRLRWQFHAKKLIK